MSNIEVHLENIFQQIVVRNQGECEFHQAVKEVLFSLKPLLEMHPEYFQHKILERLCEPERQFIFRVPWQDDKGEIHVNRGFRVGFSSVLGPYKGGLRFHPSVTLGTIKFLGFEQTFKNALTGMPIGGGKGGSDFNPKGKSDNEIMRFCQSFMTELYRHIGGMTDVPAGDIGVATREIGYMFGQYKRITNRYELGVITGKHPNLGGTLGRKEATGYGAVFFAQEMLKTQNKTIDGKNCVVSGSGNVAIYAIEKLQNLGANVVACSDSNGFIYHKSGIQLNTVKQLKEVERKRIRDYVEFHPEAEYVENGNMWDIPCELAFPCATQNELNVESAATLIKNGCIAVIEGANMPSTPEAIQLFIKAKIAYAPGKAANAGGVATSAIEMQQNANHEQFGFDHIETSLQKIIATIHNDCYETAKEFNQLGNYNMAANILGFRRVAEAMIAFGLI